MSARGSCSGAVVWRSLLFVPVNVERFVQKAHMRGADVVILDLEDSIPPGEKADARQLVPEAAQLVSRWGSRAAVRINHPWRLAVRDLEAVVCPAVDMLLLPKVDSAEQVRMLAEVVAELEQEQNMDEGVTRFIPMIETPRGLFRAEELAGAHERVAALTIGAEDLSRAMGVEPKRETLTYPAQRIALAARAAGVVPLGFAGTVAQFQDMERFRQTLCQAANMGFKGGLCIHPRQVPVLNEEFSPTAEQVAHAQRVVEAYEEATASGVGAIEVDGTMVDVPVVERLEELLARHQIIQQREEYLSHMREEQNSG